MVKFEGEIKSVLGTFKSGILKMSKMFSNTGNR
jgi:hypothetical protein